MRKITSEALEAFMTGREWKSGNTRVSLDAVIGSYGTELYLHDNLIAKRFKGGDISITSAGWPTATTKDRLNAIPGVRIVQKKGQWFLNGVKWDGAWTAV